MSNGKIAHCEIKLGDSIFNVEDSDALFDRAVQAGATVIMPMTDMFFGSREGRVADPFGNVWTIATLKEEVDPRRCSDG
jgi:PhnB protein